MSLLLWPIMGEEIIFSIKAGWKCSRHSAVINLAWSDKPEYVPSCYRFVLVRNFVSEQRRRERERWHFHRRKSLICFRWQCNFSPDTYKSIDTRDSAIAFRWRCVYICRYSIVLQKRPTPAVIAVSSVKVSLSCLRKGRDKDILYSYR